ncbi:MAG: Gar1/Naf1 family protein [Nitrososphaerota archaeon]|nr:Gar1/Naf1 family protein [Candidatus Bathyarchaeota archaeon]MCX8161881.1 Gar1/Naf1 family protein [Candidatus Bathyarchaeota archaeon]MDW8061450.1 Gar1/Naf1 family protein [Nitrososphaerota archaeon]
MQRLGVIIHISKNHNIVVKLESIPKIGDYVFDRNLRKIGIVKDIIGSTSSPFALIRCELKSPSLESGAALYYSPPRRSRG